MLNNIDDCISIVKKCEILSEIIIKKLCRNVKAILFQQSNVQPVQSPITLCGDIHGQFYDLLELFKKGGEIPQQRYIFIGDFVDRGYHSVETITLLLLYKLKYPAKIILLRGNHQSRNINHTYGFYDEIDKKYGNYNVWYYFNEIFDFLPIAAIIQGSIFCVHGGLSPRIMTIDYIRSIERNIEIPTSGALCDLMWSDPSQIETWQQNSRGAGWLFGQRVVDEFIQQNQISYIVRAHQLVQQGYKIHWKNKLITLWSAPNYCYRINNQAAIMKIEINLESKFMVFQASTKSKNSEHYNNLLPYFL